MNTISLKKRHSYLFLLLLFSACQQKPPVYAPEKFLQKEKQLPIIELREKFLAGGKVIALENSQEECLFFPDKDLTTLIACNFSSNRLDTVLTTKIRIYDFFPVTKDSIFILNWHHDFLCYTPSKRYQWNIPSQIPLPQYDTNYTCTVGDSELGGLLISDGMGILHPMVNEIWSEQDFIRYKGFPQYLFFKITDSTVSKINFTGYFPKKFPTDNYYISFLGYTYCKDKQQVLFHNSIIPCVQVCDMKGKVLKEKDVSSQYYKTPAPFPYKDRTSMTSSINYYYGNTLFQNFVYDPYRNVFLRVMNIPPKINEEAVTKPESDWVLIVADSNLNVKYEVYFKERAYSPYIWVTKEGVYLHKKKENENEKSNAKVGLFVFD